MLTKPKISLYILGLLNKKLQFKNKTKNLAFIINITVRNLIYCQESLILNSKLKR